VVAQYNDTSGLKEIFRELGAQIAAVIAEPIAGNMGVVLPAPTFLEALPRLCRSSGSLFICDEVITGFRVAFGGAQSIYGLEPDLTVLGKIVGGGVPVGAYGGRRAVMESISPSGPIYQAGTLSGNPLAMAAGIATIGPLDGAEVYEELGQQTAALAVGLRELALRAGISVTVNYTTGMLTLFFATEPVEALAHAQGADTDRYARFFHSMLDRGIYLPPSQFEAWMLSTAHGDKEIQAALLAAEAAFGEIAA
jgi:glutamate-1-semialdehyde 2,1-aminomutase